jgi:hypothetical protein
MHQGRLAAIPNRPQRIPAVKWTKSGLAMQYGE